VITAAVAPVYDGGLAYATVSPLAERRYKTCRPVITQTFQPPAGSPNNNTDDRSLAGPQISHHLDFAGKIPAKAKLNPCQIARTTFTSRDQNWER